MNAHDVGTTRPSAVVELRHYTLHAGTRETLIEVFDQHFVEGQEETGMSVIGQFRAPESPDSLVWLRGFDSMEARKDALGAFYGGPVWAAHKDVANATMVSFDNVLLLKPAWTDAGFDLAGRTRGPRDTAARDPGHDDAGGPAVLVTIHHVLPDSFDTIVAMFRDEAAPLLARLGAPFAAVFVSEHAENTFPRLPVRQGENVLVTFQEFEGTAELRRHRETIAADGACRELEAEFAPHRSRDLERLALTPTARALLGR